MLTETQIFLVLNGKIIEIPFEIIDVESIVIDGNLVEIDGNYYESREGILVPIN